MTVWPLSLSDTQRIVSHLMQDGTREGLLLADLLNKSMGASARRRAARQESPLLEAARLGRRATLDPGAFVERRRDGDGDYERLDQWQERALLAAVEGTQESLDVQSMYVETDN